QAEHGIRDRNVTGVQTCALPIFMDGVALVREYQPVTHRLRLSASPYAPTNPGKISLTLEPLVIRRTGFSPVIRYSCLHSHSCTLHNPSPGCFTTYTTLPYPTTPNGMAVTVSAVCLSPATLSAQNHLTSGLLRTLSRVAASKPTSWLSQQLHILSPLSTRLGALTDDLGCFPL